MPLGNGYFYDRKKKMYIDIMEHATDAVTRPEVFKSHDVKNLNPVTDRDTIVIHVLKQGFIRVRHWKDHLGWQFWGEPEKALRDLRKYIKDNEVGDLANVTFTDFQSGNNVTCQVCEIKMRKFILVFNR
jgi:hypothetical protein